MKLNKKKKHDDKDKKGKNKRTFNYSGKLGNMEKSCWNNINESENKVKKIEAYMTHVIEQSPTLIYVDQITFIEEYNWFTQYINIPKYKNIMTNNY